MKIRTSISEFELVRCDYSREFFNYCERFNETYLFDSIDKDNLIGIIESRVDLCEQFKGIDKWYTNIFSALYSYIPEELINNSKDLFILVK